MPTGAAGEYAPDGAYGRDVNEAGAAGGDGRLLPGRAMIGPEPTRRWALMEPRAGLDVGLPIIEGSSVRLVV
ncbi:MAG: hypothetical protein KAU28_08245 [Phycisphaerae bacterium]|nr:hypothetical protein [Phycisphaerae bacterium]